eukprot:1094658-Lingulodinium_polyedra.AAC.1
MEAPEPAAAPGPERRSRPLTPRPSPRSPEASHAGGRYSHAAVQTSEPEDALPGRARLAASGPAA